MKKFICVLCLLLGATVSHAGVADYIISMARQGIFPMEQVFIWIESLLNSTGKAYSFVSGKDIYKLRDIQKYTKATIKRTKVPSLTDVENTRTAVMLDKVKEVLKEKDLEKYSQMIESLISDETTSLDVAAALLKMTFASEKREQDQKVDIFANTTERYTDTGARDRGMVRLFINIGKKDNVRAGDFVGAIAGETGIEGNAVENINIWESFSFVVLLNQCNIVQLVEQYVFHLQLL